MRWRRPGKCGTFGGECLTMSCQRSGARRVGIDIKDLASGTVSVQVCDCGGSGAAFVQEDERDIVRLASFISDWA